MPVDGIFSALRTTRVGLSVQMKRLETISENIANAEKLPDANGKLYNRKVVVEASAKTGSKNGFGDRMALNLRGTRAEHLQPGTSGGGISKGETDVAVKVEEIPGEQLVYDPTHPRADERGFVRMPNVYIVEEMVDMVAATRAYEANVSVMNAAKNIARKALEI